MTMLLGKKVGMTQVYDQAGDLLPVTVIQAGPCAVLQVKTIQTDGYNAIQLGFDDIKASRRKKPQIGHVAKANSVPKRFVREMRLPKEAQQQYKVGDSIAVSVFLENEFVDVIGTSKGKGFAGVMKRYHFAGFPASRGTERKHRAPGSQSGYCANRGWSGGPKKGKKMSGHMGNERVTVKNHRLLTIDQERNLLVIKGSVPGPAGGYCIIRRAKKQPKENPRQS